MNPSISIQDGHVVAHWGVTGYGHFNIRISENGGPARQVERDGDKSFVFLNVFHPGSTYRVSVQGCDASFLSSSQCTSWDEISCGGLRNPCIGPQPGPIISGGGRCLDVNASEQRQNGGRVQLWACNNQDQQLWTFRGGRIVSLAGRCLDVALPELQKNGGRVQVWDCNGSVQQRWTRQGGKLRSAGGKCLDANAATLRQNGGVVQVWDCNGEIQQRWSQPSSF
jgi:hypothetical protein